MPESLTRSKPAEWVAIALCVLASLSAGSMFASAWLTDGISQALPHIKTASDRSLWVKAVFWDITLFNFFVCGWFFYRETHAWRAALAAAAFWASGSVFLGLYIAVIWLQTRSFQQVVLGKHLP